MQKGIGGLGLSAPAQKRIVFHQCFMRNGGVVTCFFRATLDLDFYELVVATYTISDFVHAV